MEKTKKRHSDRFRRLAERIVTHNSSEEIFIGAQDKHKELLKVFQTRFVTRAKELMDVVLGPASQELLKCTTIDAVNTFSVEMFPEENRIAILDFVCDFGDEYQLNDMQLGYLLNICLETYLANIRAALSSSANARIHTIKKAPSLLGPNGQPI